MDTQTVFFEMMEEVALDFPIAEAVADEQLDEASVIYEAVEQFFTEHYKHLTLDQTIAAAVRGDRTNEQLVEIIAELMIDESIGSAIATVVHGIGQRRLQSKADKAQSVADKKAAIAKQKGSKAAAATLATKKADKSNNGSVRDIFRAAYRRAKSDKAFKAYQKAGDARVNAWDKSMHANQAVQNKQAQRDALAAKVDDKVRVAKDAVKNGIRKAAGFAGRMLGKVM